MSLTIHVGEAVGLVCESGSGKTTFGQAVLRLQGKTGGEVLFKGHDLFKLPQRELRTIRPQMQYTFQDPYSALNPRMTIGRAIGEPLLEHRLATKADVNDRVAQILEICGMDAGAMDRYPHEFSGGQRQRIVIMYLGAVVETGSRDEIFSHPIHPYTKELLATAAVADPHLRRSAGEGDGVGSGAQTGASLYERRPYAKAIVDGTATRFCAVTFHGGYMADGRQRRFRARNQPSRASGTAHRVTIHGIIMLMCGLDASSTAPAMVDPNEVPTEPAVVTHDSPSVSERAGTISLTIRLPVANSGETHRPVRISMTPRIRKLPITMRNTT